MVRETRHLWISNLPENIREEKIKEHFKRYGRVQNITLFPTRDVDRGSKSNNSYSAAVSFMDIKSASKAHNIEHKIEDNCLTTDYFEPPAVSSSRPPPQVTPFPVPSARYNSHGLKEDVNGFDRSSHYYAKHDTNDSYIRRQPSSNFQCIDDPGSMRKIPRDRDRQYRKTFPSVLDNLVTNRVIPKAPSKLHAHDWNSFEKTPVNGGATNNGKLPNGVPQNTHPTIILTINTDPLPFQDERRDIASPKVIQLNSKSSESGSDENSRASSRARSQSSSSVTSSTSSNLNTIADSSDESSPLQSIKTELNGFSLHSMAPKSISINGKPNSIRVGNLHLRSNDGNLKEKLKKEHQHLGRISSVKLFDSSEERYAIISFQSPKDNENVFVDKKFCGTRVNKDRDGTYHELEIIRVNNNGNVDVDEFVPNAARTIFINNLPKGTNNEHLIDLFKNFGEVLEVDVKMNGIRGVGYCQFSDITGAVNAINGMDGKIWRGNKVTLGFSKSDATNCVWVKGIPECYTDMHLDAVFNQSGCVKEMTIDRLRSEVLVFYEMMHESQQAVNQLRGFFVNGQRLQTDFASLEFQAVFYARLEKNNAISVFYEHSSPSIRGTPSSTTSSGNHIITVPYCKNDSRLISKYLDSSPSPCSSTISTPRTRMTSRIDLTRRTRVYRERKVADVRTITKVQHVVEERHSLSQLDVYCSTDDEEETKNVPDSRPGTPLIDENPDIVPNKQGVRVLRKEVISLPLPSFSNEVDSPDTRPRDQDLKCSESKSKQGILSNISKELNDTHARYDNWTALHMQAKSSFNVYPKVKSKMQDFESRRMNPSALYNEVMNKKRRILDDDYARTQLNKKEVKKPEKIVLSYEMLKLETELRALKGTSEDLLEISNQTTTDVKICPVMEDNDITATHPLKSPTVNSINQIRKTDAAKPIEITQESKIGNNSDDVSNINEITVIKDNPVTQSKINEEKSESYKSGPSHTQIVKEKPINDEKVETRNENHKKEMKYQNTILELKEKPIMEKCEIKEGKDEKIKEDKPEAIEKEVEQEIIRKDKKHEAIRKEKKQARVEMNGMCKPSNEKHNRECSKEKGAKDKKKRHHSQQKKRRTKEGKRNNYEDSSSSDTEDSDYVIHDNSEPVFPSMYDALKARTVKKLQSKTEGNGQRDLKNIFNELKQSRAKRDIKRISTSTIEEDSDTDKKIYNGGIMSDEKNAPSDNQNIHKMNEIKQKSKHAEEESREKYNDVTKKTGSQDEINKSRKHKIRKVDKGDENKKSNKHEGNKENNNENKKKSKQKDSKKNNKHDDNGKKHKHDDESKRKNHEDIRPNKHKEDNIKKKNKHHEEEGNDKCGQHKRKHEHKHHKSKKGDKHSKTKKSEKYREIEKFAEKCEMYNGIENIEEICNGEKIDKTEKLEYKSRGSMFSPTESMNEDYSSDDCLRVSIEKKKHDKVKRQLSIESMSSDEERLVNGFDGNKHRRNSHSKQTERNEQLVKNEICNKVFYNRHKESKNKKSMKESTKDTKRSEMKQQISKSSPSPPKIDTALPDSSREMDLYPDSPPLLEANSSSLSPLSTSFDNCSPPYSPFSPPVLETDLPEENLSSLPTNSNKDFQPKLALSLPSLDSDLTSFLLHDGNDTSVSPAVVSPVDAVKVPDKSLPINASPAQISNASGFDSLTDMEMQETAVKSISENISLSNYEIDEATVPLEEKPQPGISLEETEDAIAAILSDNESNCSFQGCYTGQMTAPTDLPELEAEEINEMGSWNSQEATEKAVIKKGGECRKHELDKNDEIHSENMENANCQLQSSKEQKDFTNAVYKKSTKIHLAKLKGLKENARTTTIHALSESKKQQVKLPEKNQKSLLLSSEKASNHHRKMIAISHFTNQTDILHVNEIPKIAKSIVRKTRSLTNTVNVAKDATSDEEKHSMKTRDAPYTTNEMEKQVAIKEIGKPVINAKTLMEICQNGFNIKMVQGMWNTLSEEIKSEIFRTIDCYHNKVRMGEDFLFNMVLKQVRLRCSPIDKQSDNDDMVQVNHSDGPNNKAASILPLCASNAISQEMKCFVNPFQKFKNAIENTPQGTKGQIRKFILDVCGNKKISATIEDLSEIKEKGKNYGTTNVVLADAAVNIREITDDEKIIYEKLKEVEGSNEIIDATKHPINREIEEIENVELSTTTERCRNKSVDEDIMKNTAGKKEDRNVPLMINKGPTEFSQKEEVYRNLAKFSPRGNSAASEFRQGNFSNIPMNPGLSSNRSPLCETRSPNVHMAGYYGSVPRFHRYSERNVQYGPNFDVRFQQPLPPLHNFNGPHQNNYQRSTPNYFDNPPTSNFYTHNPSRMSTNAEIMQPTSQNQVPYGPQPLSFYQNTIPPFNHMPPYPNMIAMYEPTRPPPPLVNIRYDQPQNYVGTHEIHNRAPFCKPQQDNSNRSTTLSPTKPSPEQTKTTIDDEPKNSPPKIKLFLDIPLPPGDPPPPPFHPFEENVPESSPSPEKPKRKKESGSFDSSESLDSGVIEDITSEPTFFHYKFEDGKEHSSNGALVKAKKLNESTVNEKTFEETLEVKENIRSANLPVSEKEIKEEINTETKGGIGTESQNEVVDIEEGKKKTDSDKCARLIEHVTTCGEPPVNEEADIIAATEVEEDKSVAVDPMKKQDKTSEVTNDTVILDVEEKNAVENEEESHINEESNNTDENVSLALEEDKTTTDHEDSSINEANLKKRRRRRKTETPPTSEEPIRNYRTRQQNAAKHNSEDVYAFKEEPEELKKPIKRPKTEEPAKRERIVMTIKTTNGSSQLVTSIIDNEVKEVAATVTKRRSTRQTKNNKQVIRNSVDETIDEVVRNSAKDKRVTRRNTRSSTTLTDDMAISLPQVTRRTKGTTRKRRKKSEEQVQQAQLHMDEVIEDVSSHQHSDDEREYSLPPSPSFPSPSPPSIMPSSPVSARTSIEPTTLIDPVSGLLIPMKESDNGNYIPLQQTGSIDEAEEQPPEKKLKLSDVQERMQTVISVSPIASSSVSSPPSVNSPTNVITTSAENDEKISVDRTVSCIRATCTINTTDAVMKEYPTATMEPIPIKPMESIPIKPIEPPINHITVSPIIPSPPVVTPSIRYTKPKTHLIQSINSNDDECTINPPVLLSPRFEPLPCMIPGNAGQWPPVIVTRPINPNESTVYSATSPLLSPYASKSMLVTRNPHFGQSRDESVYQPLISPVYDARVRRRVCDIPDEEIDSVQPRSHITQPGLPAAAFDSTAHVAGSFAWSPSSASPPPAHLNKAEALPCYGVMSHSQYIHPHFIYNSIPSYMPMTTQGSIQGIRERDRDTSRISTSSPPLELTRKSPQDSSIDPRNDLYRRGNSHEGPPLAHQPLNSPRAGQIQMAIPPSAQDTQEDQDPFRKYPVMWQGQLALKVKQSSIQMHFIFGNAEVARTSLNTTSLLRIAQRMRLEAQQLDTVIRKIQYEAEHCMLLGLTCGLDQSDVMTQTSTLSNNITYMQQKQAAGIVNLALPGSEQVDFVVHIFPPCEFARESLLRIAPDLFHRIQDMSYVLVIITEANRSFNNTEHSQTPTAAIN